MVKKILNSKKFLQITSISLCIFCIILITHPDIFESQRENKIIHDSRNYFFTNPILDCEATEPGGEVSISRNDAREEVDRLKEKYDISFMSVYYRDLNNGPWLGINEKEEFVPASLLKVPLVLSLFRYSEDNEDILSKKIIITKEDVASSYPQSVYSAPVQMKENEEYSLREVAERTIVYSDNLGVEIILQHMPKRYLEDLYLTIGGTGVDSNVRVKDYASFFRILYNASYLDRKLSEEMLKILSETKYKDGIVAGVPEGIVVAHKFGEYTLDEAFGGGLSLATTEVQLHDCGIIYNPGKPYILCVMTRGMNYDNQEKAIGELSKFFFDKINQDGLW